MKTETLQRIEAAIKELQELKEIVQEYGGSGVNEPEDNRVDFGGEYTIVSSNKYGSTCFIGCIYAKPVDEYKVIIAGEGYSFQLHEDYYEGRNAISLHKIG